MSDSLCRWGFLSTAGIGRKNWKAIHLSGNGRVSAVASRSVEKAQGFIDECSAEVPQRESVTAVGSYEELLSREDVDAVYVPLPTGIRKQWVVAAAKAGKHVLCEKPAAVNEEEVQEMVDACNEAGVQFMDGVMFDHSKRLVKIREILKSGEVVGKARRISTHFSFSGDASFQESNIRTDAILEPHGCLGDLGWYCIRFTLWAAGLEMPTKLSARTLTWLAGTESEAEVPGEFSAELHFPNDVTASFYCSFLTVNQQTAMISGDQGFLSVDDFVLPFYDGEASWTEHQHVLDIDNCRWNFRRHSDRKAIAEYPSGEPNASEVNMVRTFAEYANSGKVDPFYPDLTLKTQRIIDACRRSDAAGGELVEL
ncbi:MAG: Gfo/Idh/MocA family oxidoreductase [Planctomycetota bacterium]|nr:Gfo/Idh/MocA family oxidoreductase [Planctomycetota bacterium]